MRRFAIEFEIDYVDSITKEIVHDGVDNFMGLYDNTDWGEYIFPQIDSIGVVTCDYEAWMLSSMIRHRKLETFTNEVHKCYNFAHMP